MAKVTHPEAEVYESALIRLQVDATNTQRRSTMDKTEIARITGEALESGREVFRRRHAECSHERGLCLNDERAPSRPDRDAIDAIATLLGTSEEWSSASDFLEDIANIVGEVRPHPGDTEAEIYKARFQVLTGHPVPSRWDRTPE